MTNSLAALIAQHSNMPKAEPSAIKLSPLAQAMFPVEKSHNSGLAELNALDSLSNSSSIEPAPMSVADIFSTNVMKSSPSPFAPDQFNPTPKAVMDFPLPNATMSASELTTYHLNHLRHVVTSATASREVLAELWRHLKANPDTKDQLLPTDLGDISIALAKITGARTNSLKITKAKATAKSATKQETTSLVANAFADLSLD